MNTITYPDGTHTYYTYDSLGRLASRYNDGSAQMLTFAYDSTGTVTVTDAAGNVVKDAVDEYGNLNQYTNPLGTVTQFSYDPEHKLTWVQGAQGTYSSLGWDLRNNPASLLDPLGYQQNMVYTAYNSLQSFTDASGNATAFAYDSSYDQTGMTYPDGSAEQATYDSSGNLTSWTNRRGHTITYAYNAQDLLTSQTYANGSQVSYTYDAHRNLSSVTASNGITSFTYDSADRMTGVSYPGGQSIQYVYSSGGQRTSMKDSTGFTVNYIYDAVGRLTQLTNGSGASIVSYTYDATGRLTEKQMGNGTYTTYAYDADGNPLHLINYSPGGAVLSEFDYTYDALERQTAMTAPSGAWSYGYDADGELTSVTMPGGSVQYTYDAAGNRLTGAGIDYNVNNLNEYTAVGANVYRYDADGNLISGGGWTYSYDDENQLIAMVSATDTWTYQYDGLGNRVAATHNGTVTQYLNDPSGLGNVEAEFNGSGQLVSHYTYGLDLTSSIPAGGSAAYYHFDAAGNTAQMTNASGSVVNSYTYLPFGEKTASTAGVANPFTYVGEFGVMDEGSGLYFMRNRWYSPALGRFVQVDPTSLGGGDFNFYRYAMNQPTNFSDPSGLAGVLDTISRLIALRSSHTDEVKGEESFIVHANDGKGEPQGDWSGSHQGYLNTLSDAKNFVKDELKDAYSMGTAQIWDLVDQLGKMNRQQLKDWAKNAATNKMKKALLNLVRKRLQKKYPWAARVLDLALKVKKLNDKFTPPKPANKIHPKLIPHGPKKPTPVPTGHPNDPNGKITSGFGDQGYVPPNTAIVYTIYFENQSTATAPAEIVTVSDPLPSNLDWSTAQLNQIQFNNVTISVPSGQQSYVGQVNVTTDPNPVKVNAALNPSSGVLTWTMQSVNPTTGGLPADPMAGFLPPNNASNQGTGYVTFSVRPKTGLTNGTTIGNQASIVFDVNAAIATNTVTNTIDSVDPTSSVSSLPAVTTTASFTVSWSGSDPAGAGIASYNIFVSVNSGPYAIWLPATTATSATYGGAASGNTYSFYSMATDNVGHTQQAAGQAQTTTVTMATLQSIAVTPANSSTGVGMTQQFMATGTYTDGSTQNLTAQVTWSSGTIGVATISTGGLTTARTTGNSTIGATLGGVSGSTVLAVMTFSPCDLSQNKLYDVPDVQAIVNQALGAAQPANDMNSDHLVNVADIQIVMNAVLGLGCTTH